MHWPSKKDPLVHGSHFRRQKWVSCYRGMNSRDSSVSYILHAIHVVSHWDMESCWNYATPVSTFSCIDVLWREHVVGDLSWRFFATLLSKHALSLLFACVCIVFDVDHLFNAENTSSRDTVVIPRLEFLCSSVFLSKIVRIKAKGMAREFSTTHPSNLFWEPSIFYEPAQI